MTARMTAETVVIHVRTVGTKKGWVRINGTASRRVDKIVAKAMTRKSKPKSKPKPKISKARSGSPAPPVVRAFQQIV
jgi:hypothetical protein